MNKEEKFLVSLLEQMKEKYGVLGTKAEFEAEGTRFNELLRLKEITSTAGMGIALKIGGGEDVWGILQARQIGVSEIVAPMIESAYALKKFLEAFKKHVPEDERESVIPVINVETIQAVIGLNNILEVGVRNGLYGVTVGRVDLVGSMSLQRNDINSKVIFDITRDICKIAKMHRLRTAMGGGIESASLPFIKKLLDEDLLDRFETRKIVFNPKIAIQKFEEAVLNAHRFELSWLTNKQNYCNEILAEDADRIPMLKKRIGE